MQEGQLSSDKPWLSYIPVFMSFRNVLHSPCKYYDRSFKMTPDELKALITSQNADTFCREYLFNDNCWLFDEAELDEVTGTYADFKAAITSVIQVDATDVHLVGSSKFGISMSPNSDKIFKPFGDHSDLDVVIVSNDLFKEIWGQLRQAYYYGYSKVKEFHAENVFRNFLYLTGKYDSQTTYLRKMSKRTDQFSSKVGLRTGLSRHLSYRIYSDQAAAQAYHAYGIRKLQKALSP